MKSRRHLVDATKRQQTYIVLNNTVIADHIIDIYIIPHVIDYNAHVTVSMTD